MFFQLYIIIFFAVDWVLDFYFGSKEQPLDYKIIVLSFVISTIIAVVLNLYWTYLIIVQIIRIFKREPETSFTGTVEDNER